LLKNIAAFTQRFVVVAAMHRLVAYGSNQRWARVHVIDACEKALAMTRALGALPGQSD
jgi:hypothetical protein